MIRSFALLSLLLAQVGVAQVPCDSRCSSIRDAGVDVDGRLLPGGTLCLRGPAILPSLTVHDFSADGGAPTTVRVCGGTIEISGATTVHTALAVNDSQQLRITGDDEAGHSLLRVRGNGNGSNNYVVGIWVGGCSNQIELDHLEVSGTSYTSLRDHAELTSCPVRRGRHVHHNWFHDVGGEGMFLGINNDTTPYQLEDVEVDHNRIERPGFQGIKYGQVPRGLFIHDNHVIAAGSSHTAGEDTGIAIGPNCSGRIESNVVQGADSSCIAFGGSNSNLRVVNNILTDCGSGGITLGGIHTVLRHHVIAHNTIARTTEDGILNWSQGPIDGLALNNVLISPAAGKRVTGVMNGIDGWTSLGNVLLTSGLDAGFASLDIGADAGSPWNAFRLAANSVLRNAGVHFDDAGVFTDIEGLLRDFQPDIGAHEFGADAGPAPAMDAGATLSDAGSNPEDAGTSMPLDSGTIGVDAGPQPATDAGNILSDAGNSFGPSDGGLDAGIDGNGPVQGCGCQSTNVGEFGLLLLALGAIHVRARKK